MAFATTDLLLSCEVSGLSERRTDSFDMQSLSESVDFINLFATSLIGHWTKITGFGNSLKTEFSSGCYNLVGLAIEI